ncbi:hypothetical protein V1512DRAFT_236663 [Lipomyces arxii]|uniref:uncharacterized protein n=1 Tax=Lipomyces arxii TaxID=56418 RepID=UPI0034CF3361
MFKFDFGGEDIDDDMEDVQQGEEVVSTEEEVKSGSILYPKMYDIEVLLNNMPSRMSYTLLPAYLSAAAIPRREVFDIKMQIMADEDETEEDEFVKKELQLLLSHTEDLRTDIYEGGLKSWEGAGDLVELLVAEDVNIGDGILELGCGSALPSLHLFQKHIASLPSNPQPVTFILSDYNYSVLRLMTAPNFLLAYYNTFNTPAEETEWELEITESLISEFLSFLSANLISLKFVAGSWDSAAFADILGYGTRPGPGKLLYSTILAAETIYSPASLRNFTSLLFDASNHWGETTGVPVLVAAKEIYFGVGGTVRQFSELVQEHGMSISVRRRITGRTSGVARVVLQITRG